MAFHETIGDGFRSYHYGEATNTQPQFTAVCQDTTTAFQCVRPDSGNAGPVVGIALSTGVDATGGQQTNIQPGQDITVRDFGDVPGLIASGVTVACGDKLYTTSALQGALTNVSTSAKFVGYAREASAGGTADIVTVRVAALMS